MESPTTPTGPAVPRQNPSRPSLRSSISGHSDGLSPSSVNTPSTLASPRALSDYALPKSGQLDVDPAATPHHFERTAGGSPQLRFSTVFASTRVGLGSPALDLKRDWLGSRRRSIDGPDHDHYSSPGTTLNGDTSISPHKLVDPKSGLPSPPGSNSDIGPPSAAPVPTLDMAPSSPSSHISPPRPPRRTSSTSSGPRRSPSLSSATSSRVSETRLRESLLKARGSPSATRSKPSSPHLKRLDSTTLDAEGQSSRSASKSTDNIGNGDAGPTSLDHSSPSTSRSSSPQKMRFHERSPSLPLERQLSRSSAREGPVAGGQGPQKPSPLGVDDRILEAEERLKTSTRPTRLSMDVHTPGQSSKRHGFYGGPDTGARASSLSLGRSTNAVVASATLRERSVDGTALEGHLTDQPGSSDRQREKSGGSGSSGRRKALPAEFRSGTGLFTPSPPKAQAPHQHAYPLTAPLSSSRKLNDSPIDLHLSPTTSRQTGDSQIPSPARRQQPLGERDRLERHSSLKRSDGYTRRQWSESIAGLPRARESLDGRGLPLARTIDDRARQRAESVLGSAIDRYRYSMRGGSNESALTDRVNRLSLEAHVGERDMPSSASTRSRIASVAPGDSISAVGANTYDLSNSNMGGKNPLDVLNRMDRQREQHNRQWEADRSVSVIGEHARPLSRFNQTPSHLRSTTSMSSVRDYSAAPRTAPIESFRHRREIYEGPPDSPTTLRGASRLRSHPVTEPRPMRSTTSLTGRSSASMDLPISSTEHGRLLVEAFRSMEIKLPVDFAELLRAFLSSTRSVENVNTSLRAAAQLSSQVSLSIEMDDKISVKEELARLGALLRDASRSSDQSVRDLTQIMLDLPKAHRRAADHHAMPASGSIGSLRGLGIAGARSEAVFDPVKPSLRPYSPERQRGQVLRAEAASSPLSRFDSRTSQRRSADILRSNSALENYSPSPRYSLDAGGSRTPGRLALSGIVSKFRSTPQKDGSSPSIRNLQTIEASPPSLDVLDSPARVSTQTGRSPRSPNRLKKKASSASTRTVKGASNFLPSLSKGTTTAVSTVTAINSPVASSFPTVAGDQSPTRARSIKSVVSGRSADSGVHPSSFYTAADGMPSSGERSTPLLGSQGALVEPEGPVGQRRSMDSGRLSGEDDQDAVAMLEHKLAEATKQREQAALDRRPSMSERFRTWRGNNKQQ